MAEVKDEPESKDKPPTEKLEDPAVPKVDMGQGSREQQQGGPAPQD